MQYNAVYEYNGIRYGLKLNQTTNFKGGNGINKGWVARFYNQKGGMVAQGTSGVGKESAISNAKRNLLTRFGVYGLQGLIKIQ